MIGLAYKKNIDDKLESPSLVLIELLEARGASFSRSVHPGDPENA